MAAGGLLIARLRDYLRDLPVATRALLIAELERAASRGEEIPGGNFLLNEVRSAVRESDGATPRLDGPARLVFRPLQPFLFDSNVVHKYPYRIARTSLVPIWRWIGRDLMPEQAASFKREAGRALAAADPATCDHLTHLFHERLIERIRITFAAVASNEKARRRLAGQIGTVAPLKDIGDLFAIITRRDTFALIESRLPGHIPNLTPPLIDSVMALLESPFGVAHELLPYSLVLVLSQLAAPWQLIRLAVKAAGSDHDARVAGTPYATAVVHALGEIERQVAELKFDLRRGSAAACTVLLKSIHDAVRGLRTELDLAPDSTWGRQLAEIRADVSSLLKAEIESVPGRVRRLLRPRTARDARGFVLDAGDIASTESLIELVGACRNYASELALNEIAQRTYHEVEQYLDTDKQALLEGLRNASDAERAFRQSQVDAAVRFCGKVFGQDYASILTKAAEVAAHSERKAAAKA